MSDLLLSRDDLQSLTGVKRAAAIVEWLKINGWAFELDANGRPKVARSYFDLRMGAVRHFERVGPRSGIFNS